MKRWTCLVGVFCLLGALPAAGQNRFPYGRGTDLTASQLFEAGQAAFPLKEFQQRLDAVVAKLGKAHKVEKDVHIWYGVFGSNMVAPWGCRELRIGPTERSNSPSDHHNCGIPYAQHTGAKGDAYMGRGGASRDLGDLRQVEKSLVATDPIEKRWEAAKKKLGSNAARSDDKAKVWFGVGGRDDKGPISCHALTISAEQTAIAPTKYEDCGIAWPPTTPEPAVTPIPPASLSAAEKDCFARCQGRTFCVIERRVHLAASLRNLGDGQWSSRYMDGRPAPMSFVPTCKPLPDACDKGPTSACLLGEPGRNKNHEAVCRPGNRAVMTAKSTDGRLYWICEYAEEPPRIAPK